MNDLLFVQGKDNLAGLVGEFAVIASEDIETLPDLAVATALVTDATDVVFKTGKKCAHLYITDETSKAETKSVGERDGKGRETVLTGRYPASGVELEAFVRQCQNAPSVVFYRLGKNGKVMVIGITQLDQSTTELSLALSAYFEAGESSTGEKRADQNGAALSWKYTSAHGPIEYAGDWDALFVAGS